MGGCFYLKNIIFLLWFIFYRVSVILMVSEGTDGTEQEKATEFGSLRKRPVYQDDISNMDCEGNGRRIRLTAGRMFAGQDDTRTTSGRSQGHL